MPTELSPMQQDSIQSSSHHRLLVAGPGTGKSATILRFIEYAVEHLEVKPSSIAVLTFTRAATSELKAKTAALHLGDENPMISTLHGFSLRQLMKNFRNVEYLPTDFVVADDQNERDIIHEDIKRMLDLRAIVDCRNLFNRLASNWETLNADRSDWMTTFTNPQFIGAWQEHRGIYGYALRSELVYQFKKLLEQVEAPNLDGPIEFLVVDEYQDLNKCDLRVIEMLVERGARLFCAGDDDQSIYGFRYAFPEGIRSFGRDYTDTKEFVFNECYRCGANILHAALNVIEQDYNRIQKKLTSVTDDPGSVHLLRLPHQRAEATAISRLIQQLNTQRAIPYGEIIILLRSDHNKAFSRVIADELSAAGTPVLTKHSQFGLLETRDGRYFAALTRLSENQGNDLAIRTILNHTYGIGRATIDAIYNLAKTERCRFSEICRRIAAGQIGDNTNANRARPPLSRLFEFDWAGFPEIEDFSRQVDALVGLIPDYDPEFPTHLDGLLQSMRIESLSDFVMMVSEIVGTTEQELEATQAVRIMSMHQAKGLSAEVVFVVAVEDEYVPGRGEPEEERRLLYVSMTRARRYLFLTYCAQRDGQQARTGNSNGCRRRLSRFLENIQLSPVNGRSLQL